MQTTDHQYYCWSVLQTSSCPTGVFSKATPRLGKLIEVTLDMPTRFRTCYLLGDFNFPYIDWHSINPTTSDTVTSTDYCDMLNDHFLHCILKSNKNVKHKLWKYSRLNLY